MPHGDLSDYVGFSLLAGGVASIFKPEWVTMSLGPVQPLIDGPLTAQTGFMVSFAGSLLVLLGWLFYVVRWNTINGRFAAAPTSILAAINLAAISHRMDNGLFVLRTWHLFSGVFVVGALHMIFFANAPWTSESLRAHELEKEKKKQ
tara:strand:+ start:132 stop:572 length:441 start_codon:yes stop_codon:yes gene_type:complete